MQSYSGNPFVTAADAEASDRAMFIRRTYLHLAGAILAFIGLESVLLNLPGVENTVFSMLSGGRSTGLIVMLAFMGVSWLADRWARSDAAPTMQYLGLGLYVVAQALIFVPLLLIASRTDKSIIPMAGTITALLMAGITSTAFITRKDFSFLGGILTIAGFVSMGVIVAGMIFNFSLGLFFCALMVLFAGGSILYTTSNVIHHYRTNQHVAASLALFSGVMLLLWYVIRVLLASRR